VTLSKVLFSDLQRLGNNFNGRLEIIFLFDKKSSPHSILAPERPEEGAQVWLFREI